MSLSSDAFCMLMYMYVAISFRSLMPSWEEVLLFNEVFSYFLSREETDPKVIMFFEVKIL